MTVKLTSNFFLNARGFQFLDGGGVTWSINANTNAISAAVAGSGLTSVGFADTSSTAIYAVTNSPLTANGTIDIALKTQAKTLVFAGPAAGVDAQPTFRALVAADIPAVTLSWTALGLSNSWVFFGSPFSPPGYYKDPTGRVYLRGLVKNGVVATAVIAVMPAGFRPLNTTIIASVSNDLPCEIWIDSSGNVNAPAGGSTAWLALDGVSFATF